MNVLELLEEIEDIVETAPSVPLTAKIMVDGDALVEIVSDIRKSLPDDVHQAKWIKEQKDRILAEAKEEYEKIIIEAKKQADYLVETNDITLRAQKRADAIERQALQYTTELKMRTYDYVDSLLYEMEKRMDYISMKYFEEMFSYMGNTFNEVNGVLQNNREEIKSMAVKTKNGEEAPFRITDDVKR